MQSRLYRSRTDQKLSGTCGGLGQLLGIDPTWVRLIFVLLALANGIGVVIYLVLWVVVPYPDQEYANSAEAMQASAEEMADRARSIAEGVGQSMRGPRPPAARLIGVGLIVIGLLFLFKTLGLVFFHWFRFDVLWPAVLVVAGLALLWRQVKGD